MSIARKKKISLDIFQLSLIDLEDKKINDNKFSYRWSDRKRFNKDYIYLNNLYEKYLIYLSKSLNNIHNLNYETDYWRIVIGPWLQFFIPIIFDRYYLLLASGVSFRFNNEISIDRLNKSTPLNFDTFYSQIISGKWNNTILQEILTVVEKRQGLEDFTFYSSDNISFSRFSKRLLGLASKFIPRSINKVVFINPYVPVPILLKLQLKLKQFPYLSHPIIIGKNNAFNLDLRSSINLPKSSNIFLSILNKFIINLMPKSYLEDFSALRFNVLNNFPLDPKMIITGIGYQVDDSSKIWIAEKKRQNVPYVIIQHGGNMGISHHSQTESHQIKTADFFCSWGWTLFKGERNVLPMPSLQLIRKKIKSDPSGDILILPGNYPRYFYSHYSVPIAFQFYDYIKKHDVIVNIANSKHKQPIKIVIKLNGDDYEWNTRAYLSKKYPLVKIANNKIRLPRLLSTSRICVITYNGTAMLEALAINFPSIIVLDPLFFDCRNSSKKSLNLLFKAKILHYSFEAAAMWINQIYDNVNEWWFDTRTQKAIKEFCSTYALSSKSPFDDWVNFINKNKLN
jgi:putative transferase (TIGR04331 family)